MIITNNYYQQHLKHYFRRVITLELIKKLVANSSALINVVHHKGNRDTNWDDYLDIIYYDLEGKKQFLTIRNPMIEVYFANEDARVSGYNRNYIRKEQTYKKAFPFKDLEKCIGNELGGDAKRLVYDAYTSGKRALAKNVHKDPNVFASDYRIEDWYRIQWALEERALEARGHKRPPVTLRKNFLDIEVDGIDFPGFVVGGIAPINAVTVVDDIDKTCRTFLLRNDKNPQIAEFEKDIEGFIKELHEDFDEVYGSLDYQIYMYDEERELDMIHDIFQVLNMTQPDFVLIWNASFDVPYIIDRIVELGKDPAEVMCHPEFEYHEAWFYKDKRNFAVSNKGDYTKISAPFTIVDQMIIYAALRKGQSELRSVSLNHVGKHELDEGKLDYGEVTNFKTFPYENYRLFVKYNIKDVLLQYGIERRTTDIDNVFSSSQGNVTAYEKIFKVLTFLRNRAYLEWDNQGLIIGNNVNATYGEYKDDKNMNVKKAKDDDEDDSYSGGIVADPKLNDFVGEEIMGEKSKYVFKLVIDMDKLLSLYTVTCIDHSLNCGEGLRA